MDQNRIRTLYQEMVREKCPKRNFREVYQQSFNIPICSLIRYIWCVCAVVYLLFGRHSIGGTVFYMVLSGIYIFSHAIAVGWTYNSFESREIAKRMTDYRDGDPSKIGEVIVWQENKILTGKREAEEKVNLAFKHADQLQGKVDDAIGYLQGQLNLVDEAVKPIYEEKLSVLKIIRAKTVAQSHDLADKAKLIQTETAGVANLIAELKALYSNEVINSIVLSARDDSELLDKEIEVADKAIGELIDRCSSTLSSLAEIRDESAARAEATMLMGRDCDLRIDLDRPQPLAG